MKTKIISAFPACGKTYCYRNMQDNFAGILDSDLSDFSSLDEYIQHIKDNIGKVEIIFISAHRIVRDALKENDINYILIYPRKDQKEDWVKRFINRGNNENFVNFISKNWNSFIDDMDKEDYPIKIKLPYYNRHYINSTVILDILD